MFENIDYDYYFNIKQTFIQWVFAFVTYSMNHSSQLKDTGPI